MSNEGITTALEQLNQELRNSPQLDQPTAQSLQLLIDGIRASLKRSSDGGVPTSDSNQPPEVIEQASSFITQFEASHPRLTNALSQVIDRLSDMGI